MANTIILNRICSGGYLEEGSNLGHEIVNLFKPDGKDYYYVYLMADGAYPHNRLENNVEAIYLTKGINADCVEVISVAIGNITPVFSPRKNFKCFKGGGGEQELKELFLELLKKDYLEKIAKKEGFENIAPLVDWLDTESFLRKKPFDNKDAAILKEKAEELYALSDQIKKKGDAKLVKAIARRAAHIEQLWYIIENNVCYGGIRIDQYFENNTSSRYGLAIYLTYRADKIKKPEKTTYIVLDHDSGIGNTDYIVMDRKRLSTTALATYVSESEANNYSVLKKKLDDDCWQQEVEEYKHFSVSDNEHTFLSLIKKEYDELVFSNLFQYFFAHKDYSRCWIELLKQKTKGELILSNPYLIKRELANIDLLIVSDDHTIVIENKIKSGINGLILNECGEIIETQLKKYRKYVEKHYAEHKHSYFIFMPDYSVISAEKLEGYTPIYYSELANAFKPGLDIKTDKKTEVYFEDFVRALEKHSVKVDNHYEEIMRRRMQHLIDAMGEKRT